MPYDYFREHRRWHAWHYMPTAPQPPHYMDVHALVRPNKVALICGEQSLTYAELNVRARRVANALGKLGVKAGDRVAVMAHNSMALLEIASGLSKLSAIAVLLNYRLREREVAYILNDCQAKVAIAGPELVEVVDAARAEVRGEVIYVAIGDEAHTSSPLAGCAMRICLSTLAKM